MSGGAPWSDRTVAGVALVAALAVAATHLVVVDLVAARVALAAVVLGALAVARHAAAPPAGPPGRGALVATFGVAAAVVALVGAPELLGGDHPDDQGRIVAAHAALAVAVGAAALGTATMRRLALAATLGALVVVAWRPAADLRAGLVVAWLAASVAFLVLEDLTERHGARPADPARPDVGPAARSRAVRQGLVVLALLAVLAPLVASAIPPDAGARGSSGRAGGEPTTSDPLSASGDLDTSLRFDPSDAVVMRVAADAPDFWRGQTFDTWDGRTWSAATGGVVPLSEVGGRALLPHAPGTPHDRPADIATERFAQTFTLEASGGDLLVGAYEPVEVTTPVPTHLDLRDGSVRFDEPLRAGDSYAVVSERPIVTAQTLRTHDPRGIVLPEPIAPYLALPGEVPDRVAALAAEITATSATTYDAIRALEDWIGANTTYSLDVPVPPEGADAVDRFLFVDRQGFCVQIASSLAVLLRTLDVPARVAVGYASGDQDPFSGVFTVRASDAHAWVEVWFPDVGWQGFDPTADVPLSGEHHESLLRRLVELLQRLRWYLLAVAVALVLLLVGRRAVVAARRVGARPWPERMAARLAREGRLRGRPRRSDETVTEYGHALASSVLPDARVEDVARAISDAAFSPRAPEPAEAAAWRAQLRAIARAHPRPRRWRRRPGASAPEPVDAADDARLVDARR